MRNSVVLCLRFTQTLNPVEIVVLQAALCHLLHHDAPTIHQGTSSLPNTSWQITLPELSPKQAHELLSKVADGLMHPHSWLGETADSQAPWIQAACAMAQTPHFRDAYCKFRPMLEAAFALAPPERKVKRRTGGW